MDSITGLVEDVSMVCVPFSRTDSSVSYPLNEGLDEDLARVRVMETNRYVLATQEAHNRDMSEIITAQGEYSQLDGGDVWILVNTHDAHQTKLTCQRFRFPDKIRMRYKS